MKNIVEEDSYCVYCRYATDITGKEEMLCQKYGIVPKEHVCRHFVYDSLKRIPRRLPTVTLELPEWNDGGAS